MKTKIENTVNATIKNILSAPAGEVHKLLSEVKDTLERGLAVIERVQESPLSEIVDLLNGNGKAKARPAFKTNGKGHPAHKLQGRYMGMLRRYSGRMKAQIKAIAHRDSVEAAITAMENLLKGTALPKVKARPAKKAAVKKTTPKRTVKAPVDETDRLATALANASKAAAKVKPKARPAKVETKPEPKAAPQPVATPAPRKVTVRVVPRAPKPVAAPAPETAPVEPEPPATA